MGLDVKWPQEIGDVLRGVVVTQMKAAQGAQKALAEVGALDTPAAREVRAHQTGFLTAVVAIGLALGLEPEDSDVIQEIEKGQLVIPAWVEAKDKR